MSACKSKFLLWRRVKRKQRVDTVIRQKAAALGVSPADQETVSSQIVLSSTTYKPMECSTVFVNPEISNAVIAEWEYYKMAAGVPSSTTTYAKWRL
ncbi:hypothetical protein COOONC_04358 [Cooperia oncophora]